MPPDIYYRYQEVLCSESKIQLMLLKFEVEKHTPCGVWLTGKYGERRKFVLNHARKRFALPTKEEALESFRARKKRQIGILKSKLKIAEAALTVEPNEYSYLSY